MKNTRNKVEARLIRGGNNVNDVKEMMNLHFNDAYKCCRTAKIMAEYIRTVY